LETTSKIIKSNISWKVKVYTAGAPEKGLKDEEGKSKRKTREARGHILFLHLLFEGKDSPW